MSESSTQSLYARINALSSKKAAHTDQANRVKKRTAELSSSNPTMPKQGLWLCTNDDMGIEEVKALRGRPRFLHVSVTDVDDDDDSEDSWNNLSEDFAYIRDFEFYYILVYNP